jgi:hypothetical protein
MSAASTTIAPMIQPQGVDEDDDSGVVGSVVVVLGIVVVVGASVVVVGASVVVVGAAAVPGGDAVVVVGAAAVVVGAPAFVVGGTVVGAVVATAGRSVLVGAEVGLVTDEPPEVVGVTIELLVRVVAGRPEPEPPQAARDVATSTAATTPNHRHRFLEARIRDTSCVDLPESSTRPKGITESTATRQAGGKRNLRRRGRHSWHVPGPNRPWFGYLTASPRLSRTT